MDPSPAGLLCELQRSAAVAGDVMTQHASFVNYSVSKTSALVAVRGKGAVPVRARRQPPDRNVPRPQGVAHRLC
eukprot:8918953-Alexandrium_andersonii.AAC.1